MKFCLATLATTLLVGLTGGLLHAQAPIYGPQGPDGCGQCGQCGQSAPVYLILTPSHHGCDWSGFHLFGGNWGHGCRYNDNCSCGCGEPQCGEPRCGEPCRLQPRCELFTGRGRCNDGWYNDGRCNDGRCNDGRCNDGRCGHASSTCIPVKVISCAPPCQGCGSRWQGQNCGQPAPCYPNAGCNQGPGYYGPGGALPAGPVTTAEPPQAEGSAYLPLIQAIQAAQEKDNRAMREMMENRQASLAVVRAMQNSDANTVATFEKMLQQMKESSPAPAPAPSRVPGSSEAPIHVMPGAQDAGLTTGGDAATLSQLRQVSQDLSDLSRKIGGASAEVAAKDGGK